jgi:alkylation response protein AidB-like acyl-CoA dehydrogenase
MTTVDSAAMQSFRREVRDFVEHNLPDDIRERIALYQPPTKSDLVRWQKILHERGWFVAHWPKEFGGGDWTALQRFIYEEECHAAGAPSVPPFSPYYVGPVLYTYGSKEQQDKYLPSIRTSDTWWCQGYSEPGAGSDLYSLRTRAEREGDFYRVNGQKIWTTTAQWADMVFALVRTSNEPRKQSGISFLLIDLKSPGVTVRPIVTMDQEHHVNEVFFEDVMVPVENRIGEEGKAWTYSHFLLSNERIIVAQPGKYRRMILDLRALGTVVMDGGKPLSENEHFQRRVADLEISLRSVSAVAARILGGHQDGGDVGPLTSILKLRGSEVEQKCGELAVDVLGRLGAPFGPAQGGKLSPPTIAQGMVAHYLLKRSISIAGGSNEVMHNIMAKSVFGFSQA